MEIGMEQGALPCKRKRCDQPFTEFSDSINASQPRTPQNADINNSNFKSEKNKPRMIVLALCAPKRVKIKNYASNTPKCKNLDPVFHPRLQPQPFGGGAAATKTAVSVYKITDLSCSCCDLLVQNSGLNLSGCAVISKGIVVVEGEIHVQEKRGEALYCEGYLAGKGCETGIMGLPIIGILLLNQKYD